MPNETLRPDPALAWRCVDGEAVVVRPESEEVVVLNAAGACIWTLADGSRPDDAIAADFAGHAARDGAEGEALAFLAELERRGFLVRGAALDAPAAVPVPAPGAEAPAVLAEETLEVLAGGCDSSHTGNPGLCRTLGPCSVTHT